MSKGKKIKKFIKSKVVKDKLEEDFQKGIEEVKETSKLKELIFFILGILMTCTVQFIVYKVHPSNFTGERLEEYLVEEICEEFGFTQKEKVSLQNVSVRNDGILAESDTLFITGKYEEEYTFIAIFNKGNKEFIDFVFASNPEYELVKSYKSEKVSDYELYFTFFNTVDLDGDGEDEVVINLDSEYASYAPRFTLVFKEQDDRWDLLEPDLSVLEEEISGKDEEYDLVFSSKIINDSDNKIKTIYGLHNYGELEFYSNGLYNYYNFCYRVPILKPEQSMPEIDTFAYLMLRIDSGTNGLVIERNWNNGKVMISPFLSDDDIYYRMGFRTDSHIFYDPLPR